MKCPHCNSHMDNYETTADDRSQVAFYRCTICEAQHVSSSIVTTYQLEMVRDSISPFSGNPSQNLAHLNL